MSIYRRDPILPEWEPVPYTLTGQPADDQERGFDQRAQKTILWQRFPWQDFPKDGVFGEGKDWLRSIDAEYCVTVDGEDLILIRNVWFGFPDPPEWGLISRPRGSTHKWAHWGHFPNLPLAWTLPPQP